jgi:hypothetical protein
VAGPVLVHAAWHDHPGHGRRLILHGSDTPLVDRTAG